MMTIHQILKNFWGYDSFRPLQEDIINSVLEGHDTLGLMPTGGGKSITFQVPALYYETGVTVVVTPLISLMKDQVDNLAARKIRAVCFHSGMSHVETRANWEKLVNGNARFLYIAPERLANDRFMLELRNLEVRLIVIDEAHCISQWGYDFRPSYLNIRSLRKLKPGVPVLALTATATPQVAEDIRRQLDFKDSRTFQKSFVRDNINYIVRPAPTKITEALHILSSTSGSSIVYVRSRKRCREISEYLNAAGISSTFYHAGLDHSIKESRQNEWQRGEVRVMVATNAFGMGIDKPDVRVVVHHDVPPSLEEYYQEAGRAGRDGKTSYAVLLTTVSDVATMRRRVTEAFPDRKIIRKTYERVCNFLHVSIGEGYDSVRQFDIDKFCRTFRLQERQCRYCLKLLSQAGYLHFIENPDSRSRVKMECTREELYYLHDLSPAAEEVLNKILRLYTGIFMDYVYIRESEVATVMKASEQRVYEALLELSRAKIISFIPRSDLPMIYFPTAREETDAILIGKKIYEERRQTLSERTEAMIDYAFIGKSCRVRRMLAYFGEIEAKDCCRCDVCRSRSKPGKPDSVIMEETISEIIGYLKSVPSGATFRMIEQRCSSGERTSQALSFLCNEGFLCFENDIFRIEEI